MSCRGQMAIIGLGKRDVAFDAGLPQRQLWYRPGMAALIAVGPGWHASKIMDQHLQLQIAKDYGSQVIAICPDSRLSALADIHLPIMTQESDFMYKPSTSRYVMLAAIDILVSQVAALNQRKSREKLRRIKHELDEHRQGPERLPVGD
ncbi:MAG: hypothetical protein U5L02_02055 [Rheinheimera sp.]|nr:hypothetical protein [Rheinheimera sp.]